jgi:hypothetical protein
MAQLRTKLVVGTLVLFVPRLARAVCGGASPDLTAASPQQSDVEDCIAAAASGDTIQVPAGTATWDSVVGLPGDKDLSIIGATVVSCSGAPITCTSGDETSITCGSGVCFGIDLAAAHRISGFTLLAADNGGIESSGDQSADKHFRVDHNRIVSSAGWAPLEINGGANAVHPQGIFDNNILVDVAIHSNGTVFQLDEGDQQHELWAQQTPLGDSVAIVYIEDNHFQNTPNNVNNADSNYAGRYVYRFNNTTSGRQTCEVHSVQGLNRASQRFEIYGNSGANSDGFSGIAFIRGGSGVAFGNRLTSNWPSFGIEMDNVRSEEDPGGGVGACDGSSAWDQNTPGQNGYRCRDQIGSSRDLTQWNHSPAAAYDQELQPVYFWDNLEGTGAMDVSNSGLDTWLGENRDWYDQVSSFDGTSGVGVGAIGDRPATCTPGVAYWATDEGEWNAKEDGFDGQLYKCTAANTWTLNYLPCPYPHPWTTGGEPPPPVGGTGGVGGSGGLSGDGGTANGGTSAGGGAGGSSGSGASDSEDDGGCGCRLPARRSGGVALILAGALLAITIRRARRRDRRPSLSSAR